MRSIMQTGTIKSIIADRGFGFIARPGDSDLFFHCKDLVGIPFDEQLIERRVDFVVVDSEKGPRAANVRPAE